jgi:outer membrane protein OmpA-like peptidoglycan-associated protein
MRRWLAVLTAVSVAAISAPAWANEFLDYFGYGEAELSAEGYRMTRRVLQYVDGSVDPHLTISAHMDTAETAEFTDELAARRAQAVATELVRLGVDPARIRMRSCGDKVLARPTAAAVPEQLNRRVIVEVYQGPWRQSGLCRDL